MKRCLTKRKSDMALARELRALDGISSISAKRRRNHLKQLIRVRARRAALVHSLGGRCVVCGSTHDLEFDHYPARVDWDISKVSQYVRIKRYEEEAAAGKLRLLCSRCNGSAGGAIGNIPSADDYAGTPLLQEHA